MQILRCSNRVRIVRLLSLCAAFVGAVSATQYATAQQFRPVVPGTGQKVEGVGDDFEDANWNYRFNGPKSSEEIDEQKRLPTGESTNRRWYEGIKRGHPDIIKRVTTPEGGLEGSEGALLLQSRQTGIPGRPSYKTQQDDFICNVHYRLKQTIPASRAPNFVTRVFLPPVDEWEERTGPHFAVRAALGTHARKPSKNIFASSNRLEEETYWPGMFIEFISKEKSQAESDYAYIRVRSNSRGGDYRSRQIEVTGWWTMGMSFTPDGAVHYYAKPGLEDLTEEDRIASEYPYGYKCEHFKTFFFNVCNGDDGRTWSTAFVVDDSEVFVAR